MVGAATISGHIRAADVSRREAVFCVDNVHPLVSIEDMQTFPECAIGIEVVTIFRAEPRRRRNNNKNTNRVAFRLCIFADETARPLNPEHSPETVVISEWYFRQSEPGVTDGRRSREVESEGVAAWLQSKPTVELSALERERIRETTAKFMASFRVGEGSVADNVDRHFGASGASSVFADEHEPQPITATMYVPPIGATIIPSIKLGQLLGLSLL
jgi:hypothetical protein